MLENRKLHRFLLKYAKTTNILNYFECYYIFVKLVCKANYISLFWLRDFENARAGRKVILVVRFIILLNSVFCSY